MNSSTNNSDNENSAAILGSELGNIDSPMPIERGMVVPDESGVFLLPTANYVAGPGLIDQETIRELENSSISTDIAYSEDFESQFTRNFEATSRTSSDVANGAVAAKGDVASIERRLDGIDARLDSLEVSIRGLTTIAMELRQSRENLR